MSLTEKNEFGLDSGSFVEENVPLVRINNNVLKIVILSTFLFVEML